MGPNSDDLPVCKKVGVGWGGEMVQWLRVFPALVEDMG